MTAVRPLNAMITSDWNSVYRFLALRSPCDVQCILTESVCYSNIVAFCFSFLLQYSLSIHSHPLGGNLDHQEPEVPPPLPSRNRPLLSPVQTPGAPPPLPPRQYCPPHLQCADGGEPLRLGIGHNVHFSSTNHYVSNTATSRADALLL
jgi:hypothetical protein